MAHGARRPGATDAGPGRGKSGRGGFTLIEILVATTILLVIVLMMSMVFQQSSGAFQSGTNRVNAQKVLRNVLGVISRDMAMAVDSRFYPGCKNEFSANRVAFVALTGTPDRTPEGDLKRAPQWIEFSYDGVEVTRTCYDLENGAGKWSKIEKSKSTSDLNPDPKYKLDVQFKPSDTSSTLPLRVDVYAEIEPGGKFSFVRGRSAGRDREWGTEDDIVAGGPAAGAK